MKRIGIIGAGQLGMMLGEAGRRLGIECLSAPTDELSRAAGNVGCLTGVLWRERQGKQDA